MQYAILLNWINNKEVLIFSFSNKIKIMLKSNNSIYIELHFQEDTGLGDIQKLARIFRLRNMKRIEIKQQEIEKVFIRYSINIKYFL